MGLYWWLSFLACISYCMLSKAEEYDEQMINDAFTSTEGSIHGFRPCLDESCSALSLDSEYDTLSWHVLSAVVRAQKNINQVPDPVTRDSDVIVQHCMPLHRSTVDQISSVEARHPDITDIKMKVIEDFIGFISDFALLNTTGCDSPMSLIGYIKLAVRSLEVEYSQYCGEKCDCVYTAGVEEYMDSTSTTDSTSESMDQTTYANRLGDEGYQTPCPEDSAEDPYEEIYAEDQDHSYGSSILVGSIRGVPGVNFPNYTDIPLTSFSCADKKYVPGFYADQETGCQVFHVCYEHRRESFLCPLGTTFNQPILACDYWYSSNCSLAVDYYEVNVKSEEEVKEEAIQVIKDIIEDEETVVAEEHSESTDEVYEEMDIKQVAEEHGESTDEVQAEVDIRNFLPVKAKVIDFEKPVEGKESVTVDNQAVQDVQEVASQIFDKMVSTATDLVSKTRVVIDKIPEPDEMKLKPSFFDWSGANLKLLLPAKKLAGVKVAAAVPAMKIAALKSTKVIPLAAVKTAIPVAAKVAAVKTAIPVAAKVAAVKTAIPVAAKVAAVKTAIPVAAKAAAVKAAIPVAAKAAAVKAAIPVAAKAAAVKAAIPVAAKAAAVKAAIPVAAKAAAVKAAIPVAAKAAAVKAAIPVAAKAAAVKAAIPVAAKAAAVKAAIPVAAKAAAVKAAIPVAAKAAAVKAAIPVAAKAAAVKAAIPVAAKAAAVKAAIPVAAKAAAVKAAIPVAAKAAAVKASIPLFAKSKLLAFPAKKAAISGVKVAAAVPKLAVPVLKTKMLAPVIKGKFLKAAAVPVLKAKIFPVKGVLAGLAPVAKAKLIKAAAISPLTKKTLALGYMKLLKAKKLALMG